MKEYRIIKTTKKYAYSTTTLYFIQKHHSFLFWKWWSNIIDCNTLGDPLSFIYQDEAIQYLQEKILKKKKEPEVVFYINNKIEKPNPTQI
jgi:hypothetical protein